MTLPDLAWQFVYGRLAWTFVLAALLLSLWPRAILRPRLACAVAMGGVGLMMALPGDASPAWKLGLAFQYPSGLLMSLCVLCLTRRWQGRAPGSFLPLPLSTTVALAGSVLYLDAMGVLSLGLYYAGFGPFAAPALALLGSAACVLAILRRGGGWHAPALLGAFLLFSLLRLPTGNLWDAMLDPLLWGWALASLARRGLRRLGSMAARRSTLADVEPVPVLPVAGAAAMMESFSISKEQ
ncbi:hypothetical protein [Massilia sp. Leaf139]|uniref:hypothetical protein n=1 Tax=Massilia sp. Leaf139 TaxID=1736272 RepID=UPI0007002A3D|nr:hypothetical protein [Massilia sp. Leaf139]KQQ86543.1 hypothetical protein ASF77_19760 [Massilia sp. Leaf139]